MPSNTRAYTTTTGTLYRNAYTTAPEAYTATAAAGRYGNRRGGATPRLGRSHRCSEPSFSDERYSKLIFPRHPRPFPLPARPPFFPSQPQHTRE